MRLIAIVLATTALTVSFAAALHEETLRSVLAAHKVPVDALSEKERQQAITSFADSGDRMPFLLAYYDDDGSGSLPPVLHVVRYDNTTGDLRRADIYGKDLPFRDFGEVMTQPSSNCMGSALHISERDGLIAIDTHINPSAGCVLILDSNLRFSAGLWGWSLGRLDGYLILEENMIHFADTHPARLTVYDPKQKQLTQVYPANDDPKRQEFSKKIEQHLPSRDWCMQSNSACDPKIFTTDIVNLVVDEQDNSFAFDAQMSVEGFGEEAGRAVQPQTVHYICKLIGDRWLLTSE